MDVHVSPNILKFLLRLSNVTGWFGNDISVLTFHPKGELLVLNQAGHWQSAWHLLSL